MRRLAFATVLLVSCGPTNAQEIDLIKSINKSFADADRDGDQRLSVDEYVGNRGANEVLKRDFRLFDFNEDGFLSRDEFAAVPDVVHPDYRGAMPDPLRDVFGVALAALDASLGQWDQNPDVEVDTAKFLGMIAAGLDRSVFQPRSHEADPNGDGKVTREEARRFLEIQLGARRSDGKLLRFPDGRVVQYFRYLFIDLNRNDRLERAEYLERSFAGEKAEGEFNAADLDRDDALTFDEFCTLKRAILDPVVDFQTMDHDLDGFVSPQELAVGTPVWNQKIADYVFPAFDTNGDGKLSLAEYRMTMLANPVLSWTGIGTAVVTDVDDDGALSFTEFRVNQTEFLLLRLTYFHRLDVNSDGVLDQQEFTFKVKTHAEFSIVNADGSGWRKLFKLDGYPTCGSPTVSPDGKQIAFDAYGRGGQRDTRVFVMTIDGTDAREIAPGEMPSWSSDGQKLAYTWRGTVHVMNADGANSQPISQSGRSAQWSPDGKSIAFYDGTEIKTYDVEAAAVRTILEANAHSYRRIYWDMTWSPGSDRLCFKAENAQGVASVVTLWLSQREPRLNVHQTNPGYIGADMAWHPDGDRVVFSMYCTERKCNQLYEFNPNTNDPPRLFKGQDSARRHSDVCWTPDGRRLIVVSN
jgi:Tol biopolymer transport system component/Ca2+-binding EF-hand superfamily protein